MLNVVHDIFIYLRSHCSALRRYASCFWPRLTVSQQEGIYNYGVGQHSTIDVTRSPIFQGLMDETAKPPRRTVDRVSLSLELCAHSLVPPAKTCHIAKIPSRCHCARSAPGYIHRPEHTSHLPTYNRPPPSSAHPTFLQRRDRCNVS